LAKGKTLSQARGHPKAGETYISGRIAKPDARIKAALARIKGGDTLAATAKSLHVSRERLKLAVSERGDYVRQGRRYHFIPRQRNDLPLYSNEESIRVLVDDANAILLGEFMAGVRKFLRTNRIEHLAPFLGGGVTDIQGRFHPFETDPEELYRLDAKGRAVFHQIYQLSN
jgi:hypothetical protein